MGSEDILRPSEARGTCCACCRIARNTLFRMRRRSTCRSACEWTVLHFPDLAYGQDSSASLTKSVSAPRAPKKKGDSRKTQSRQHIKRFPRFPRQSDETLLRDLEPSQRGRNIRWNPVLWERQHDACRAILRALRYGGFARIDDLLKFRPRPRLEYTQDA